MGGEALKLPWKLPGIKLDLPRPKAWDLAAFGLLVAGLGVAGANLAAAGRHEAAGSISGALTFAFVLVQLAVGLASLMALGKTAKQGTIWGNLAAVAGMFVGISGVLLAAALYAAA